MIEYVYNPENILSEEQITKVNQTITNCNEILRKYEQKVYKAKEILAHQRELLIKHDYAVMCQRKQLAIKEKRTTKQSITKEEKLAKMLRSYTEDELKKIIAKMYNK